MYVSVPKNYSGVAFGRAAREEPVHKEEQIASEAACECETAKDVCSTSAGCNSCRNDEKNPLSCLLSALRNRGKGGFDSEDFLLIGLISLLVGREGNEDILLILAMLLLI